jgi:hypothetical protein
MRGRDGAARLFFAITFGVSFVMVADRLFHPPRRRLNLRDAGRGVHRNQNAIASLYLLAVSGFAKREPESRQQSRHANLIQSLVGRSMMPGRTVRNAGEVIQ